MCKMHFENGTVKSKEWVNNKPCVLPFSCYSFSIQSFIKVSFFFLLARVRELWMWEVSLLCENSGWEPIVRQCILFLISSQRERMVSFFPLREEKNVFIMGIHPEKEEPQNVSCSFQGWSVDLVMYLQDKRGFG